jgi:predicted RNase H-like nuclease
MAPQTSERVPASRVAGVDGCKAGWVCITRDLRSGALSARVFENAAQLADQTPLPDFIGWDIPIGLCHDGTRRECDRAARRVLGSPRCTSVFNAPIRPALAARSPEEASRITADLCDGLRVSLQTFWIMAKVREVDELLAARPALQGRIREVHPEVCFWAWNHGYTMRSKKKSAAGKQQRSALAAAHFGATAIEQVRAQVGRTAAQLDDVLDAFAALWSAERIAKGIARTLPDDPPRDARGLRMEIVY